MLFKQRIQVQDVKYEVQEIEVALPAYFQCDLADTHKVLYSVTEQWITKVELYVHDETIYDFSINRYRTCNKQGEPRLPADIDVLIPATSQQFNAVLAKGNTLLQELV